MLRALCETGIPQPNPIWAFFSMSALFQMRYGMLLIFAKRATPSPHRGFESLMPRRIARGTGLIQRRALPYLKLLKLDNTGEERHV